MLYHHHHHLIFPGSEELWTGSAKEEYSLFYFLNKHLLSIFYGAMEDDENYKRNGIP